MKRFISSVCVVVFILMFIVGYSPVSAQDTSNNKAEVQGEGAAAQSGATAGASQSQDFSQTFEASEQKRQFNEYPNPQYNAPGQQHYAEPMKTWEIIPMEEYKRMMPNGWSEAAINAFLKEDLDPALFSDDMDDARSVQVDTRVLYTRNATDKFQVALNRPEGETLGQIAIRVNERNVPANALFAIAGTKCLEMGGTHLYVASQGAKRVMHGSGSSFGIGGGHMAIAGGPQNNIGGWSAGFSHWRASSTYAHEPWARFWVIRQNN